MTREQSVLKAPGVEIPLIALDDWKFWVLLLCAGGLVWAWRRGK